MDLIEEFIKDQEANGIGRLRIRKYRVDLGVIFGRAKKDRKLKEKFENKDPLSLTTEDFKDIVRKIEASSYSEWTKHDLKVVARKFVKWLNKKYNKNIDTSFVSIKVKDNHKLPEEILTQEEVERLVNACDNVRDKAFVSVLYESGARIGELLSLRIKHVQFDQYGAVLIVNGKTGSRRVRIINSANLLKNYINNHPFKTNPESYVWLTKFNRKSGNGKWALMDGQAVRRLLRIISARAGITKRVYPHLFRHSRATHLANVLTESQLKEYLGWTQSSNMAGVYVHLSGKNVDDALLKAYGIKREESKPEDILLKFNDMGVSYSSADKMKFELLLIDFLKAIAEEFPQVKEKFRSMVKERNAESLFGVESG